MQTLTVADFALRLAVGVGCGAIIGLERQWRARMAGLRTNALRLGRLSRGGVLAVDVRAGSRGSRRDAPCLASTPLAATRLIAVCLLER